MGRKLCVVRWKPQQRPKIVHRALTGEALKRHEISTGRRRPEIHHLGNAGRPVARKPQGPGAVRIRKNTYLTNNGLTISSK